MRQLQTVLLLVLGMMGIGYAAVAAAPDSLSHGALHLAVRDVGISFGNAPRVHGVRFNWRDEGLQRVDGFNLTVLGANENPGAVIRGVAVKLWGGWGDRPWVDEVDGLGLSPVALTVGRSRGILLGAYGAGTADAVGIQVGGLGLLLGQARGIQAGMLIAGTQSIVGLTVSGIGVRSPTLSGINVGGLIVFGEQRVSGINASGLVVVGERVGGINAGGLGVAGERVAGINVGGGVIGHRIIGVTVGGLVGGFTPRDDMVGGLATAGAMLTDDLKGCSVAAFHRVNGVQRGVTIGLVNYARTLSGVQLGVVNIAQNNHGMLRALPILNAHFGK
jgi:hypothetical protein